MFSGIIQKQARVTAAAVRPGGLWVSVAKPQGWRLKLGDSVAVNGVCSTVAKLGTTVGFFYMPETLKKTYFGSLKKGQEVNLELSLKAADRLDGHVVLGHVDAAGTVTGLKAEGESRIMTIGVKGGAGLLADKGSVAVEGVSLTVVKAGKDKFTVHLIPHTWQHTNLHAKKIGDAVNVEFDILAKYIKSLMNQNHASKK